MKTFTYSKIHTAVYGDKPQDIGEICTYFKVAVSRDTN